MTVDGDEDRSAEQWQEAGSIYGGKCWLFLSAVHLAQPMQHTLPLQGATAVLPAFVEEQLAGGVGGCGELQPGLLFPWLRT